MLIAAPISWLYELAEGPVKTQWGKVVFKAGDPCEAADEILHRQEKDPKNEETAVLAFQVVAPLLAEHQAISEYKKKNPYIDAPEVLDYEEALALARTEFPYINEKELVNLLDLLKNDPSMKKLEEPKKTRYILLDKGNPPEVDEYINMKLAEYRAKKAKKRK